MFEQDQAQKSGENLFSDLIALEQAGNAPQSEYGKQLTMQRWKALTNTYRKVLKEQGPCLAQDLMRIRDSILAYIDKSRNSNNKFDKQTFEDMLEYYKQVYDRLEVILALSQSGLHVEDYVKGIEKNINNNSNSNNKKGNGAVEQEMNLLFKLLAK